jgi:hypothetical protein
MAYGLEIGAFRTWDTCNNIFTIASLIQRQQRRDVYRSVSSQKILIRNFIELSEIEILQ